MSHFTLTEPVNIQLYSSQQINPLSPKSVLNQNLRKKSQISFEVSQRFHLNGHTIRPVSSTNSKVRTLLHAYTINSGRKKENMVCANISGPIKFIYLISLHTLHWLIKSIYINNNVKLILCPYIVVYTKTSVKQSITAIFF